MHFMIFIFFALLTASFFSLEGVERPKTVLITGASQGIGLATAKAFQECGFEVWGTTRGAVEPLSAAHPGIHFCTVDIKNFDSIQQLIETIGTVDILVNNAGYGLLGAVETASYEEVKEQFEINLFSVMRFVNAVLPKMRERGYGHIIQLSSTSGVRAVPGLGIYAASKFALEGYSEALAVELEPWNIAVTIIEPGTVNNSWAKHCSKTTNHLGVHPYSLLSERLSCKLTLLAPKGQPCDEIAQLIVQVTSEKNPPLRCQTNTQAKQVFADCLIDPTGNRYKEKWRAFLHSLIDDPI